MNTSRLLSLLSLSVLFAMPLRAADTSAAANAINSLGIDLLEKTGKPDANALISPYSIEAALAMTYAGADGQTREEMAKALHFPEEENVLNNSFAALGHDLEALAQSTQSIVENSKKNGGPGEPITLSIANNLFCQRDYTLHKPFLDLVKEKYGAPVTQLNFKKQANESRAAINSWVADQTKQHIRQLIPVGAITPDTRLVLVNAIYLKAAWAKAFKQEDTQPAPFHINDKETSDTPMMSETINVGYAHADGYTAVSLAYIGNDLQFVVLLPDDINGLPALEARLNASTLADCAKLQPQKIKLYLPKFRMEPPTIELAGQLEALGMKTAFDIPRGSADFSRMAIRTPDDYLFISKVFHKTFLSLDENGTEAAAATAVVVMKTLAIPAAPATEVRVDHPFLFAIQHKPSGACIFLGRVTGPGK